MTDDKGVVVSRKGALETCGQPADKQASKESGEPHLTSSEVVSPDLILHQHKREVRGPLQREEPRLGKLLASGAFELQTQGQTC